jgi:hypothetical protein
MASSLIVMEIRPSSNGIEDAVEVAGGVHMDRVYVGCGLPEL